MYFLAVGALTNVPRESKASVLHLETLSQQHWAAQTCKSVATLTHHHSQLELTPQPCCSSQSFAIQNTDTDFPLIQKC